MGLRFFALACLVGAAFAGPLLKQEGSQCSTRCLRSSNQKFDYEIGKAYTYEYRGENVISAAGKPKQKSTIEGLAVIQVVDRCEMVLQLKNLRIQQKLSPEEIQDLTQKLEEPVPFAYEDGKVEHVCPGPNEDLQSLNIKKGLISAFINTMPKLDSPQQLREFDSLGNCITKYTVKYVQGLEIRKEKSLKSCSNRHSSVTAFITNPYENPDSKIHTLPIFPDEELVCKQQVEDKIIKMVECQEHARIKPLRQRESVIQFEGKLYLKMLSITPAERVLTAPQSRPESIQYNFEERKDDKNREREAEQLLREICSKNQRSMDITVSKDFIQLVSLVKNLPYPSLSKIHSSLKNGRLCSSKKIQDLFADTLPMTGSDAAIKLMVQLLENKEISGLKAKFWPVSLALITKPTRETVAEVVPLLKEQPSAIVLLGVSAMVHRFCSVEDCRREPAVQEITAILNKHLGEECSNENESQVFAALKALGNMGYHGDAERSILSCAQNKDKPTRLRLAAIDAFRRTEKKRPEELLSIYKDTQENSEIRIAVFSSVMKQADAQQIRSIKRVVEQENDDQVSGYTSSFIKNMKKSSSPLKKSLKRFLQEIEINPPKVNYWENSKNIELSTFSETFNVGGSVTTDIIHSQDSKIPRSLTTRFDADVLNNNVNVFEVGVRAEGLEAIIKNLIGLKDKIPKNPSWNIFSSDNILGNADAEASLFFRTMNTEIFDLSASDLSGIGEMIKIADFMSQMAQGKSSDFSHSFLFMNSELIIPSVTGRSYSFGLTGSATLGLTASTKLDIMRFPRHTDAIAHFQPSMNVEVSTTVGIQSNKQRPDIKLTSRMHLESDMKAQFKIKDGHLAIASVSLPSENIVLAKMSSDIVEIDSYHHEKPVFERMQKKVDYCFDKLQKPLGISICGMLEVPKPFVTKTFPFVHGVGSVEFSIKKTDRDLKSFEIVLERPKHSSPIKKYRASFDTPGSRIQRRFSAELEVKQQGRSHQELSLELVSPFKQAGGKGLYTYQPDFIQGVFDLHSSSSKLLSFNATAHIASSRVKKVVKPTLKVVVGNYQPIELGGTLSITKGRKQLVTIDIKSNKPSRKPFAVKGTILKDGILELSRKAEWKVSSDISLSSKLLDTQIRSTVEKQSKQAQTVSASLEADYKKGSQKHSIKLSGTSQQSSSKLSTNAQFQCTELPQAEWSLKWEMQGKPKQSLKNDITLKYGRNPEKQYISIRQNSILPMSGPGQCNVVVKAPHLQIDSELSLKHEIVTGQSPKIHLEADLCYKADKHVKGLLHLNYLTRRPLKSSSRAEIEYPGGNFKYSDEIEETSTNKFEGNAQMQWKESKKVELNYIYQILSKGSEFHHELETSLRLPKRSTPIESKASLKLNKKSVAVEGSMNLRRESSYSIQAQLNKVGESQVQLQTPKVDGYLKFMNERQQKAVDMDLRVKGRTPRRITALARTQLGNEKSYEAEILWDADRRPDQKVALSSKIQITSSKYSTESKLQVTDIVNIVMKESGDRSLLGCHEGKVEASVRRYPSFSLEYSHDLSKESIKSRVKISKNNVEKVEMKFEGKLQRDRYGRQCSVKAYLTSLDRSFESKELEVELQQQQPSSSSNLKTSFRLQTSPIKTYKVEMSSERQPNGIQVKAQAQTPHKSFSKQSVVMSIQKSESSFSTLFSIELPENKEISISSELQKKSHEMKSTVTLRSPFDIIRDVQVHLSLDSHRNKRNILSYLDVNNARICDVEASLTKASDETRMQGHFKLSPIPNVQFQGVSITSKKSRNSFEVSGEIQLQGNKKVSIISKMLKDRSGVSMTTSLSTPFKAIKSLSTSYKQTRTTTELTASAYYMDNKEISLKSQMLREQSKLAATVTLETPYKIKEAKAYFSVENQESRKNLLAYIDANGERKGDIEASYITSSKGVEIQSRWKTAQSAEVSAQAKLEKRGKSYSLSTKVLKGASLLKSTRSQMATDSLEKIIFDLQVSREISRSIDQYIMKLSGPMTPVSLKVSISHSESNALKIEANACHGLQESDCLELKALRKVLKNSEGYRHYQKITFDLQKTSQKSSAEKLCSADIIFTASEHDYNSKIAVEYQGKNIGYEVRVHKREHMHDHCSIDCHIFTPQQTSRVRANIKHEQNHFLLEVEAVPNAAVPQKSFGLEIQKEYNQRKQELTGYIRLSHPKMQEPILLTGRAQKEGRIPKSCKLELQYSSVSGSRVASKSLIFELESELQSRSSEKKISCKLFNADKSLDASLEMKKEQLREHVSYGYGWSYKTRSGPKNGGVVIKMSHKKAGQPRNIDISYYTPSVDLKIQGRASQQPTDLSISLLSSGRMVKEIVIKSSDNCVEMEVQRSGPFFKSSFCINKSIGNAVQFVSLEAYYRRHKCLDISIGTEPENPAFMDIKMQWKKDDLCQALSEITGLSTLLHDRSLQELERELKIQLDYLKNDIIIPEYQHWMQELKQMMRERWENIKNLITRHHQILKSHPVYQQYETLKTSFVEWAKELIPLGYIQNEVLKPLSQALKCLMDTYFQLALKHIPDVLRIIIDVTREQFEHCLKKFCVTGTFCHDFRRTYERYGLKKACKVVYQKMEQSKRRVQLKLSQGNPIPDMIQKFRDIVSYVQRKLDETVGKFFESKIISSMVSYIKKLEHRLREEAICYLDKIIEKINEIFSKAERDEDFRTVKSMLKDVQKKLQKAWINKEKLAAEEWEPMKQNMLKKAKEILRNRMEVTEFEPKQGNIQIRVRHPLQQRHIQVVKNAITATKQKIQQSVSI